MIFGCVGSSFLGEGFLQLRQVGATLHRGAQASHYRGLSCCGAQAPGAQAQQSWLTGPVAPRHAGSSQTRAQTHVPCIGRQILNHCATREAPVGCLLITHRQETDTLSYPSRHLLYSWSNLSGPPGSSHVTHYSGQQALNTQKLDFTLSLDWKGPGHSGLNPSGKV